MNTNDPYRGSTAPLTSKVAFYIFIQQMQVLNIVNMVYTLRFFPLQIAVCFIILTYLVPVLFTFCIQGVLKLKKNNSVTKRLSIYWNTCTYVAGGHDIKNEHCGDENYFVQFANSITSVFAPSYIYGCRSVGRRAAQSAKRRHYIMHYEMKLILEAEFLILHSFHML